MLRKIYYFFLFHIFIYIFFFRFETIELAEYISMKFLKAIDDLKKYTIKIYN